MYKDLENKLSSLQEPTAIQLKSFDELFNENIAEAKKILNTDLVEWLPLESDAYTKNIRVLTLRQMHNQADKNLTVKSLLLTTATKEDLDNLGAELNIFRDLGEYPYADFEFSLLTVSTNDIVIPKGLVLNSDDDKNKAFTKYETTIKAGDLKATVIVELEAYINESDVKTENLITDLTYTVDIKQLDIFKNGDDKEDDNRYRLRLIASNDAHNTAGSESAYKFYTYTADSRIDDVSIPNDNEPLEVNIYIASFSGVDDAMIDRVYESCNEKYTRPLGDDLSVYPAQIIEVNLTGDIELLDLLKQDEIDTQIKANFNNSFFIGQDFMKLDFYRKCGVAGTYDIKSAFTDVLANDKQIIKIVSINFNYTQAIL
jgi:phage-related baseplate assembly protein